MQRGTEDCRCTAEYLQCVVYTTMFLCLKNMGNVGGMDICAEVITMSKQGHHAYCCRGDGVSCGAEQTGGEQCGWGRHPSLFSVQRCVAGDTKLASSLSQQDLRCGGGRHSLGGSATVARTTAALFLLYDSLIEKCSTLPGPSAARPGPCVFSSKLSV
jgi:hypothetical protein